MEKSEHKTITIEILVYLSLSFEFPGGHQRGQQWNARRTALFTSLSLSCSARKRRERAGGSGAGSFFAPDDQHKFYCLAARSFIASSFLSLSLATTAAAFCRDVRNVLLPYDDLIM